MQEISDFPVGTRVMWADGRSGQYRLKHGTVCGGILIEDGAAYVPIHDGITIVICRVREIVSWIREPDAWAGECLTLPTAA